MNKELDDRVAIYRSLQELASVCARDAFLLSRIKVDMDTWFPARD